MQYNVIRNAKRNIVFGLINKLIVMICPFLIKTVVRYTLGVSFLGLDSLFTSVISVLSLSELGLSSAIVYHLYKPVADNNIDQVNAILNFYKKAYRCIGVFIMVVGICLIPVLPSLISGDYPDAIVLWKVYLIFLVNTTASYFMYAYLTPLITVHQREDINSNVNSVITIVMTVAKVLFLVLTKNYYYYAFTLPVFTIVGNLLIAYRVKHDFPQYRCVGEISSDILADLKQLLAGTFIQRACGLTRNSLDSICISVFLGLSATAMYNNYYYILAAVTSVMTIIASAFAGGIGNHVVIKDKVENFFELQKLDFLYLWIAGWFSICLACLYQPFMKLWMGKEAMLNYSSVFLFCIYFYLLKLGDIRGLYSTARGLWWEMRWRALAETILNIVLNIVLGKLLGINGIIIATIISLLLCNCIWATKILFDVYFDSTFYSRHIRTQAVYSVVTFIVLVFTYKLCSFVMFENELQVLFADAMICLIVPNVLYILCYYRTDIFKETLWLIKGKRCN